MSPQVIIALAIAAASLAGGFGSAWKIQSWRYGAKEAQRAQQQLADERLGAAAQVRRLDNGLQAQSAAMVRERDLRAAAAGSRTALVGLHDATASALRDAAATHSACTERATAIGELLGTMAAAGGAVSEKADRHASDAKTLIDAWPK